MVLYGDHGNDSITDASGLNTLFGCDDNDSLESTSSQSATLYGGRHDDTLVGSGADDTLLGDHGNDSVVGGARDDWIEGADGDDTLDGQEGSADTINFHNSDAAVTVDLLSGFAQGEGADVINTF